jgi:hypothetical protein
LRLTEARIADRQIVRVEWKRSGTETEQQHGPDQISTQKKIDPVPAPATIAPAPTKPAPGQLGRTEDKKAQAHWKPKLRPASTRDGASRAADTKRAIKGFWDWSR